MKTKYSYEGIMSEVLLQIGDAIRSIYEPKIRPGFENIHVGMKLGRCKNCGCDVVLRQPWLSKLPVVNDGIYLVHCENDQCHNYYGIEGREEDFGYADFVDWKTELINEKHNEGKELEIGSRRQVINIFETAQKRHCI